MKKITIVAAADTVTSTFTGPMDVFKQAGVLWNRFNGLPENPLFELELVTIDGDKFRCANGLNVMPHRSLYEVEKTDLIIIASLGEVVTALRQHTATMQWLWNHYHRGTHLASVCSGAFLLAETGLLDGKTATTHWGYAPLFRERYPSIILKPERLITDEGDLFCSAGFMAGIDLSLYLVNNYCGREVALQCAKAIVHDINRTSQSPYSVFQAQKSHQDGEIIAAQIKLEDNYSTTFSMQQLSSENGMSLRNFERRFKAATGDTPVQYLQRVRVEIAKRLLEETSKTFEEITFATGYEDSNYFRKVFIRHTGVRPQLYRQKFQPLI